MLPARIAYRYLRSRKSHSAVGAIATVSIIGMAVATAAIVCVMSVFNGFRSVIGERLDTMAPDVLVEPAQGKVFADAESLSREVSQVKDVAVVTPTLSDNALMIHDGREMPVWLKGVIPGEYERVTKVRALIDPREGRMLTPGYDTGMSETTLSIGVASQLRSVPGDHVMLFAPRRQGRVNMANPAASFITDSLTVTGVYRAMQNEYDENRVLVDLPVARRMLQYDTEASALEIGVRPGADCGRVAAEVAGMLGEGYVVRDRYRQQEMNFRMVEIEKWVSFLLLGFILLIASFNVISTLAMLVLEKESNLGTLSAMGMSRRRIGSVFAWESMLVTFMGGIAGIALGVVLCLLQQHFGILKIGDGTATVMSSYPVQLKASDLLLTLVPIAIIGAVTALITARFARRRTATRR